jgi:Uncharacterized conserved protein
MNSYNKNKIIVIGIMSYYARQIFNDTKLYEFRKSPIKRELIGEKIYVYSAKEEKSIIGYFRVSDVLEGTTKEIMQKTGYDKRSDGHEIIKYYGPNNPKCFALKLYDVKRFNKPLTLNQMRKINSKVDMPQYLKFIYEDDSLYNLIKELD